MDASRKDFKVTVQGVESPVPAVLRSEQAGFRPSISNDCNGTMVVHLANVSDNTTSKIDSPAINPFQRASKLAQTPEKTSPMARAVRSRSSPPALSESTSLVTLVQAEWDYLSKLGKNINKLTELMRLSQRSKNSSMRDLLSTITKLHACAKEENAEVKKRVNQNLMTRKMPVEATPKRPREDNSIRRKGVKYPKNWPEKLTLFPCDKEKSPSKTARMETPTDENWMKVKYKTQKSKNKNKKKMNPTSGPDAKTKNWQHVI